MRSIQDVMTAPARRHELMLMRGHEERLRFHAEALPSLAVRAPQAETDFLNWVGGLLKADKFMRFRQLFRRPFPTVALVDEIHEKLNRVFSAPDASDALAFTSAGAEEDWKAYGPYTMTSWEEDAKKAMRYSINALVVVDMPAEPVPGLPTPYYSFVQVSDIVDYERDGEDVLWAVYKTGADTVALVDSEKYEVYRVEGSQVKALLSSNKHGLGYCPARFFWTDSLNSTGDLKKSPLSAYLSDLDWLLFFSTSKKHLDLYAPYPIYSSYAVECDYESPTERCDNGHLRHTELNTYLFDHAGGLKECPRCAAKRFVGPGSFVEVPAPQYDNDPDLKDPVRITSIDEAALAYNVSEVERLEKAIYTGVVGTDSSLLDSEAVNELQVSASFESQRSVLKSLAKNLEAIKSFVIATICGLRYGDGFAGVEVSMGEDFHIRDKNAALEAYATARDKGAPYAYLESLLSTAMRTGGAGGERAVFLAEIEPLKHLSPATVAEMAEKGYISRVIAVIKLNFGDFVARFERENTDITRFGDNLTEQERVKIINETFYRYVNEEGNTGTGDARQGEV